MQFKDGKVYENNLKVQKLVKMFKNQNLHNLPQDMEKVEPVRPRVMKDTNRDNNEHKIKKKNTNEKILLPHKSYWNWNWLSQAYLTAET